METINLGSLLGVLGTFGPYGLLLLLWYLEARKTREILDKYKEDMAETRKMYESNVKLVEGYESVAGDLKDIVVLNTRCLTQLSDEVRQNQYCPMVRVEKKSVTVETGG